MQLLKMKEKQKMKKVEIKGIIPPIVTPMHEDESINTEELRRQVDRQKTARTHSSASEQMARDIS